MPERFKVVCTMQGAIQVLSFTFYTTTVCSVLLAMHSHALPAASAAA